MIAEIDVKLEHLARDPRCASVMFEAVPPFRGIDVRGTPELVEGGATAAREDIAGRHRGTDEGRRYAAARISKPEVLVRLRAVDPRVWNLRAILPT